MAIILERTSTPGAAKLFLDGVNEVLKKASVVKSTDLLTSLTFSGKQVFIDLAVQCWNEAIHQLYSTAEVPLPFQMETSSITLAARRDYDLATDLVTLFFPLHDETNGHYILEYKGGYTRMNRQQPQPANYTGTPSYGAIHPGNGKFYIDRTPTSAEIGRVYSYDYGKELHLSSETDTFPFDNTVFWAMVPVVHQLYQLYDENKYTDGIAKLSFGRAARYLIKVPQRTSWLDHYGHIQGDPLNAE